MKLILLSFLILFSAQNTMAQNSLESEESIHSCDSTEAILIKQLEYLNRLEDNIYEKKGYLIEIKRDLDETRAELEILSRKCENYSRSCESTNRKIEQYNSGNRFFKDKIKALNNFIAEANEENDHFNALKRSYQKACRPYLFE